MSQQEPSNQAQPSVWHALPATAVLQAMETSETGLSMDQARERFRRHGPNVIPRARREGPIHLICRQVNSPLVYVLLGAGALPIMLGKGLDGLVVLGTVVLNTVSPALPSS
jgi:magnesium-transporting ATPase (P-type)